MNKLFDKITTNQSKINIIWIDDISKDGEFLSLALVDQRVDCGIHWINLYLVDSIVCFVDTYQLDRDLSIG